MKIQSILSLIFLTFLFVLFSTPLGWAEKPVNVTSLQDEELETLLDLDIESLKVFAASRREQKFRDAPGIVTVITGEEITRFGANTLHDVLFRQPNTYVYGSVSVPDNFVSLRGVAGLGGLANHTLLLINGRPVRSSLDGGPGMLFFHTLPAELIDRIEIIRGPGSVLYGSGAFGGTINIVTKGASEEERHLFTQGYGSFNTWQTSGFFSKIINDFEFVISGKYFDTNGWKYQMTDATGFNGTVNQNRDRYGIWGQMKYKRLTVSAFFGDRKETVPGISGTWPQDENQDETVFLDIQYDHPLSNNWRIQTNITYNGIIIPPSSLDVDPKSRHHDFLFEADLFGSMFDETVNIVLGTTYQSLNGKFIQVGVPSNSYHNDWFTFYTQVDYQPWDFLTFIAGVQVNKTPSVEENYSPRFGILFNPDPQWGVKLLYGRAFRSASGIEQAIIIPGALVGNPQLGPEKINTFDAQIYYNAPRGNASLTYYKSKQTDSVTVVAPGGILSFANGGDVDFWGLEFEGKLNIYSGWQLIGSVTYQENEDSTGAEVGLIPNFMAKAGLSYTSPRGYSLGIFDTYFSNAVSLPGTLNVNPPADSYNWLSANFIFDVPRLANNYDFPDIKLSLYAENLLNEEVFFPEWINRVVNTFPLRGGIAVYGNVTLNF